MSTLAQRRNRYCAGVDLRRRPDSAPARRPPTERAGTTAAQYGGPVECVTGAIWDEGYLAYDFGDHPMNPVRLDLTMRLARSLGVLDRLDLRSAVTASEKELMTVHSPDYLLAVREASADPNFSGYGLGTTDDPV